MWISDYLPFALVSFIAAGVCAGIAVYAWGRRQAPGIEFFALLMASIAMTSLMGAIDYLLSAQALAAKELVAQFYVLGGSLAALLTLLFVLRYTHHDRWLTLPVQLFFWLFIAAGAVLLFTNPWHHLYWPSITATGDEPWAKVVFEHAPLTDLLTFVTFMLPLSGSVLLIANALRAPAIYRRQSALFVLAVLILVLANLVYYLALGPWQNFDFTPVAYAVSGSLLALAIFRYQAVDLAPVALDTLFATLRDGVLVVNERGLIVSANPAASTLLALDEEQLLGRPIGRLPEPWPAALAAVCCGPHTAQEVDLALPQPGRSIEVTASALLDRDGRRLGSAVVLHNVTGYRTLQRSLAQANADLEMRVAARTTELRAMRDALAEHVANLSRHLSVLYEVILLGNQSPDVTVVRDQTLETVMTALHADGGFLMLWDATSSQGEVAAAKGIDAGDAAGLSALPVDWLFGESVPHMVLDMQQPDVPAALRLPQMTACLTSSVRLQGVPAAAIGIFWQRQPPLSVEAIALFRGLVDQLAILAENARLRQVQNESLVQEERSRLARELHDSVTQALYALALSADTTANAVKNGRTGDLEARLGRIAAAARQALREMRLLLYELRLAGPQRPPLAEALRLRLDAVENRAGIAATLAVDPDLHLPPAWEQHFYWIAMEALNNALKHAAAAHVAVSLAQHADTIKLTIRDDGCGMSLEPAANGGQGLRSMRERAAQMGGGLTVSCVAPCGVEVNLCVPIPAAPPAGAERAETLAAPVESVP